MGDPENFMAQERAEARTARDEQMPAPRRNAIAMSSEATMPADRECPPTGEEVEREFGGRDAS